MAGKEIELSVILPCRNEELAIGECIELVRNVFDKHKINGELIVSDSSQDGSAEIAKKLGANVVKHDKIGYGNALIEGFKHARGKYIFYADADGTYDFNEIPVFLKFLKQDYDLVVGNRFKGDIEKRAMPFLNKYVGNPLLSFVFRLFFKSQIEDVHSGMRAVSRDALNRLNLRTGGMELASEMIIKAVNKKMRIKEVPINYYKRKGYSKLRRFSDGWRHLRFMLMYAPTYLFLIPGMIFFFFGFLMMELFFFGYGKLMILGSFFIILGYQIIALDLYAKAYMKSIGFIESDKLLDMIARKISFESGIFLGLAILVFSFFTGALFFSRSGLNNDTILIVLTLAIIGVQTVFSALLLSIFLVEKKN